MYGVEKMKSKSQSNHGDLFVEFAKLENFKFIFNENFVFYEQFRYICARKQRQD